MKIALVHDHLAQDGGAERVLKILQQTFPEHQTYTLFYNPQKADPFFKTQKIRTSWMQDLPGIKKYYQWYLPLMPVATESFDLQDYDLVLSDTSSFVKGVITNPGTAHLCYCHTPTRYLWNDRHSYVKELKYNKLIKLAIKPTLSRMRLWDYVAAQRPDVMLANSRLVQQRIAKFYRRPAEILYPPVETDKFSIAPQTGNYYLAGGRLVFYKRFDLVVRAFSRLGIPLKIFGEGPELENLRALAKSNIEFLGKVKANKLSDLFAKAIAFINPQVEDFGITPVEVMAAGRPVIAYGVGGAAETIIEGQTGTFIDEQSWEAIADAVVRFTPENYRPELIKQHAEKFSVQSFQTAIKRQVADILTAAK